VFASSMMESEMLTVKWAFTLVVGLPMAVMFALFVAGADKVHCEGVGSITFWLAIAIAWMVGLKD
jgi:hypothetical protein